jgi:hypothetical protein
MTFGEIGLNKLNFDFFVLSLYVISDITKCWAISPNQDNIHTTLGQFLSIAKANTSGAARDNCKEPLMSILISKKQPSVLYLPIAHILVENFEAKYMEVQMSCRLCRYCKGHRRPS